MVPHSWILKCLEMVGAAKNMISIISNSMVNWKTVLTSGGMAHVTLDPSTTKNDLKLYEASKDQLDSLVQVVRIFSQDIKMSFGLDKCAVLEMRRERQVGSSGIELPDHQHIGEIEEKGFKYLGILQLDQTLRTKMKGKITSEYIRRDKKLCRSKLNGEKLIDGINTWAVVVVRYSAGIVDWTMEEVANMDRRTRKILAMNGGLHTRNNVARLYLPRKEGERGLIGIEDCVRRESKSLMATKERAQSGCFKLR